MIRQGPTAERTAFADRFRRLLDPREDVPRALLALMPDEARLRRDRRLLARYPGPVFLAQERDVAKVVSDDRVWQLTNGASILSLEEVLERVRPGRSLPSEPPPRKEVFSQEHKHSAGSGRWPRPSAAPGAQGVS